MSGKSEKDSIKDPAFQKVVDHFLKTPPKPHDADTKKSREPKPTKPRSSGERN